MRSFEPDRCAVIDNTEYNVLIRGNLPLESDGVTFAYDGIAKASGVDLSSYNLLTISLIDNVGERYMWAPELETFGAHPEQFPKTYWPPWMQSGYSPTAQLGDGAVSGHPGHIVWWPFEGLPENTDPAQFLKSPGWDFSGHIEWITGLMNTCSTPKLAIYVHCTLGADRTGAFHIGYEMYAHGKTLDEAMKIGENATPAGAPNADYCRLVEAYSGIL